MVLESLTKRLAAAEIQRAPTALLASAQLGLSAAGPALGLSSDAAVTAGCSKTITKRGIRRGCDTLGTTTAATANTIARWSPRLSGGLGDDSKLRVRRGCLNWLTP